VIKGGRVACSGIRMNDIPQFPYRILWEERQILSVANLTRQDPVTFCPSRRTPKSERKRCPTRWRPPMRLSRTSGPNSSSMRRF
jgi:hypothetical protein